MATQITNRQIRDDQITAAKINSTAGILPGQMAVTAGVIMVGDGTGVGTELVLAPGQFPVGNGDSAVVAVSAGGGVASIDVDGTFVLADLGTDETATASRAVRVPSAAQAADTNLYLRSDNTWVAPTPGGADIFGEVPAETPDSSVTGFTFDNTILANTERVYINGMRLDRAVDYTVSGAVITFTDAPETGDVLFADYRY